MESSASSREWRRIGLVPWERLRQARLQTHWAAQLLCAAADARLAAEEDDSHSSFVWDEERGALCGRAGVALAIAELALVRDGERKPLSGLTLAEARDWLSGALGAPLALRDYDMPEHPVRSGARFDTSDTPAFAELAAWVSNGDLVLARWAADMRSGPLLCWPHHFDIGGILEVTAEATVGYGLSPGDQHHQQPYFYVTPYPTDSAITVNPLPFGTWQREEFFGAVLVAPELAAMPDAARQRAAAERFLNAAIGGSIEMVSRR